MATTLHLRSESKPLEHRSARTIFLRFVSLRSCTDILQSRPLLPKLSSTLATRSMSNEVRNASSTTPNSKLLAQLSCPRDHGSTLRKTMSSLVSRSCLKINVLLSLLYLRPHTLLTLHSRIKTHACPVRALLQRPGWLARRSLPFPPGRRHPPRSRIPPGRHRSTCRRIRISRWLCWCSPRCRSMGLSTTTPRS